VKEIVVRFRWRTIFAVLTAVLVVALLLHIMSVARQVLVWMLIAVFLSMAINPAVDGLQRRWIKSRTVAVILAMLGVLLAIVAIGALFILLVLFILPRTGLVQFVDTIANGLLSLIPGSHCLKF
jgi:predicted PurR-regulated permease PerM